MNQNSMMNLFDEIRFEINNQTIDKTKNVGVTTTMKGYCSFTPNDIVRLQPAGWKNENKLYKDEDFMDDNEFVAQCPLYMCMGFFERYRRALVNCNQTLILIRSGTDSSAIMLVPPTEAQKEQVMSKSNIALIKQTKVNITKIKWVVKYFEPNVKTELGLMHILDNKKWLPLEFQHWDTAVYPLVPQTITHTWPVRAYSGVEKPRYLLIAMVTESDGVHGNFNHCSLRNIKAYLNADEYPYENQNADFDKG
ncbi:uncharacterized protein LOC126909976, partial [Daktulosphaira vitifoliae]|uniref:uncharacterized protein LOC126909976 n=1 Tax=Daktulosphaira vitifoliae TaxID=58002 RepID=UPI0021AAECA2